MTIRNFYQKILFTLKSAQIPNAENETREILCFVLKKDWAFLLSHPKKKLSKKQIKEINQLIQRRLKNEPLAYILGYKNFYGLDFIVNKNVLIPRPETELMVEKTLNLLNKELRNKLRNKIITYIDIGTGSGCIPISIIKNLNKTSPFFKGGKGGFSRKPKQVISYFATDISSKALEIAKQNAEKHRASNQIKFIQSDLLSFLSPLLRKEGIKGRLLRNYTNQIQNMDNLIITANLPYLSQKLYQSAHTSVKDYEPEKALVAGKDGLDYYQKLLDQIKTIKSENPKTKITAFFEISPEQKDLIKKEIIKRVPRAKINSYKDLAKKWRLVKIKFS
jgi:release factor glutamine methyltransferase